MTTAAPMLIARRWRSRRSAAIAGIIFAVLLLAGLTMIRIALSESSLQVLQSNVERYGAIVEQAYLHIGSKLAGGHGLAQKYFHLPHKLLIKRVGHWGRGGAYVTRAVAFAGIGQQRKLAHYQHLAAGVAHAEVHLAVFIRENTQVEQLAHHPVERSLVVGGGAAG